MAEKQKTTVAVVGLGATGLPTLKNLLETGFDATGYESNNYVGGLWRYTEEKDKTSVLTTTVANLSKIAGCYTDHPYPDDYPDYPNGEQTAAYLGSYAEKFGLLKHARLGMKLLKAERDEQGGKWLLRFVNTADKQEQIVRVDKVVFCVGLQVQTPKMPNIPGLETFSGTAVHSNNYKDPSKYDGKRVVVVGLGNTGADTVVDLTSHASKVYVSHRSGAVFMSRRNPKTNKPSDYIMSIRLTKLAGLFSKYLPSLAEKLTLVGAKAVQNRSFKIRPEWKVSEILPAKRKVPIANDSFVPALEKEQIQLRPALTSIKDSTLAFPDGSTLDDIHAIIFATGHKSDYSHMDAAVDPTRNSRKDWSSLPGSNHRPLPRLYQGIFSLDHPESLAFLGTSPFTFQALLNYDISSLAVAQIWAGNSSLPSLQEMNRHVDAQHAAVAEVARTGDLANVNLRNNWDWFKWCDQVAGLGIAKRVGYGWEGWKFWWQDRRLCKMVMDGVQSPHLMRLFDEGKRRPWEGARAEVEKANRIARGWGV